MKNLSTKITFYRIKDNQTKIDLICQKARAAFDYEKRLMILVPNNEAGEYIDGLLWRKPAEGFYPHLFTQEPTQEWIAITKASSNINQAVWLLNIGVTPAPFFFEFEEIFELFDETTPQKASLSNERLKNYQTQGVLPMIS